MRGEEDIGAVSVNVFEHLGQRLGLKWRCGALAHPLGHQDRRLVARFYGIKNLCPTVGEPAVAQEGLSLSHAKLPRDSFHGVRATTGHQNHGRCVVSLGQARV